MPIGGNSDSEILSTQIELYPLPVESDILGSISNTNREDRTMKRTLILINSLLVMVIAGSFSDEGSKQYSSSNRVLPQAETGDLVALEGFEAKVLYSNLKDIEPTGMHNSMVPGLNGDFVAIVKKDNKFFFAWYKENEKKEIAYLISPEGVSGYSVGIYPWGENIIMVTVYNLYLFQTNIYKLTGPFQPAGIKGFGLH